jgi:hypothetical protein
MCKTSNHTFQGHLVEGVWVVGAIERDSLLCFCVAVEKRDAATIIPLIDKWILPGIALYHMCLETFTIKWKITKTKGFIYDQEGKLQFPLYPSSS